MRRSGATSIRRHLPRGSSACTLNMDAYLKVMRGDYAGMD
jgi:hypothetical protein